MTTPALWAAAKRLFDEALEHDPADREAFLRRECAEQPELLEELQSLVAAHRDGTDFLEMPVGDVHSWRRPPEGADGLVGQSVGVWRIVGLIGYGGMGVVYRAERADDAFRRQAALKIVRAGASSTAIVERFRRERETLAALDHPNIARLLDGGATATGEPYFVMELVDGSMPVDRYADEHRLTIDQRLELFQAICAGVNYAHANFVVHRDIKPDNILVGANGVPKLVDFGVAKISSESSPSEQGDDARTWLMTPDYASPEQLGGLRVTTASDVYSLGVLLFVLLTGERPYVLRGSTVAGLSAELQRVEVQPPSRVADSGRHTGARAADTRSLRPAQLARRLRGDLDAIVTRALSRDPASRYRTVEHLADEIARHRTSRPVRAREGEFGYATARFARRYWLGVSSSVGIVLLVILSVFLLMKQAELARDAQARAERRFEDARQLARTFLFDVHDALAPIPGTTAARALMMRTAVAYLERLQQEAAGDRTLLAELATAFVRVGDAQGHPSSANLGDTAGALASYRRAIELAGRAEAAGGNLDVSRTLAMARRKLADVLAITGDLEGALAEALASRQQFAAIADRPGASLDDRFQAGVAQIKLGDILGNSNFPNLGRPQEAATSYGLALSSFRQLAAEAPDHVRVRRYLALTLERIGTIHETAARWPEALAAYRESFDIRQALANTDGPSAEMRRDLAIAHEKLGNVQRSTGEMGAAIASYRGALDQFLRLAALDPSDANAARTVAISREKLAAALADSGASAEAIALLTGALATHRDLSGHDADNVQARCDVARVSEMLGDASAPAPTYSQIPAAACAHWRESLAARRALRSAGPSCAADSHLARLATKLARCR